MNTSRNAIENYLNGNLSDAKRIARRSEQAARLCAAAPDILEACKALVEAAAAYDDATPGDCLAEGGAMRDALHAAKRVILKAEGGAQ